MKSATTTTKRKDARLWQEQNHRQKIDNRGTWCMCRGGLTFKFNKNFIYL